MLVRNSNLRCSSGWPFHRSASQCHWFDQTMIKRTILTFTSVNACKTVSHYIYILISVFHIKKIFRIIFNWEWFFRDHNGHFCENCVVNEIFQICVKLSKYFLPNLCEISRICVFSGFKKHKNEMWNIHSGINCNFSNKTGMPNKISKSILLLYTRWEIYIAYMGDSMSSVRKIDVSKIDNFPCQSI